MKHTIDEVQLKGGGRGLFIDVEGAPVMHMMLNFRAGDYLSPKNKWEVAHLLEHVMLGANNKYPKAREFQAELQKNGAFFNAYTNAYDITYVGECADFEWRRVLELLFDAIESPLFKEEEFIAESGNVREELSGDLNEHFRQVIIASRQAHGMVALPDGQRLAQLKNIKLNDLKRHYEKTHTKGNLQFIIAGNVARRQERIVKRLEALTLKEDKRIELPNEKPKHLKEALYVDRLGVDNLHFVISLLASEALDTTDDDALGLLNTMLTSTLHSGILGEAREKGLAYHIMSSHSKGRDMTNWWFGAQLLSGNAAPVFEIINKHLSEVISGEITNRSIDAAKKYSLGRFKRSAQTVGALARHYGQGYFFDTRIDHFDEVEPRIRAIDKAKLTSIANRMIEEEKWGLTVLGSGNDELARTLHSQIAVLWQ